jgi:hypothetical protein
MTFGEFVEALDNIRLFAKEYLNDIEQRHINLGINPSGFGAGVTGIPFTLGHAAIYILTLIMASSSLLVSSTSKPWSINWS